MRGRVFAALFWKELISLSRETFLAGFVVYAFTVTVYSQAIGLTHDLNNASIGIVDEDQSPLTQRLIGAFRPPQFQTPVLMSLDEIDPEMAAARRTFVIDFPPKFEQDLRAGRPTEVQILIDATAMMQAGIGAGYIQSILSQEIPRFFTAEKGATSTTPVSLVTRIAFNPNLESTHFSAIGAIALNVTMLAVLLAGAAVIREREHGTLEHLLAMPVTPLEIMLAKVGANGLAILSASALSLFLIVRLVLAVPIAGSPALFLLGVAAYLFFTGALGVFLATIARSMPQLGLLFILVVIPLNLLSGANTPVESMPKFLQYIVQFSPTTHFVSFAQAILIRGAGFDVVWKDFAAILAIGGAFFLVSLARFRAQLEAAG